MPYLSNNKIKNIQKEYRENKNLDKLLDNIFNSDFDYIYEFHRIDCLSYDIKSKPEFIERYSESVYNFLEKSMSKKKGGFWGQTIGNNYSYLRLIQNKSECLNQEIKTKIVELVLEHHNNFYSKPRKLLINEAIYLVEPESDLTIEILKKFYRVITDQGLKELIDRAPGKENNEEIKKLLKRINTFNHLKYTEEEVKNNEKVKIELTKDLARTPSLIKKIKFPVKIELDHIKKVAPAMRFKFLQFAFKHEINQSRYKYRFGRNLLYYINMYKERDRTNNLIMPEISVEEMKELLFSVCLKKNNDFTKFINGYSTYMDCIKK